MRNVFVIVSLVLMSASAFGVTLDGGDCSESMFTATPQQMPLEAADYPAFTGVIDTPLTTPGPITPEPGVVMSGMVAAMIFWHRQKRK